jgi:hypothetical protein
VRGNRVFGRRDHSLLLGMTIRGRMHDEMLRFAQHDGFHRDDGMLRFAQHDWD